MLSACSRSQMKTLDVPTSSDILANVGRGESSKNAVLLFFISALFL